MSGIVLSAAVRQNLLALQDTAASLATTQNDLSTGKKINSALDNPTNFFTAAGLDNRASDISNLLDGISNGVQALQAANTGITSLESLVSQAKSVANQALQTSIGYSTKSSISGTITGATADDLRGTSPGFANSTAAGTTIVSGAAGGATPATGTTAIGGAAGSTTGSAVTITTLATTSTNISALGASLPSYQVLALTDATNTSNGYVMNVNHFNSPGFDGGATYNVTLGGAGGTIGDVVTALNFISGSSNWSFTNGHFVDAAADSLDPTFNNAGDQTLATALGLGTIGTSWGAGTSFSDLVLSSGNLTGSTALTALSSAPTTSTTLNVNGNTISFAAGAAPGSVSAGQTKVGNLVTDGAGNSTVYLGSGNVSDLLNAVDIASGVQTITTTGSSGALSGGGSSVSSGAVTIKSTANGSTVLQASSVFNALGLGSSTVTVASSTSSGTLGTTITAGSTLTVDGKTISFTNGNAPSAGSVPTGSGLNGHLVTDGAGNSTVYLGNATLNDVANAIDIATGVQTVAIASGSATRSTTTGDTNSTISGTGALSISTGLVSNLSITGTGNALAALGLNAHGSTFSLALSGAPVATGQTLAFAAVGNGTATSVTFGDGTGGTVKTLDQLNAKLATDNLQATLDTSGKLTITTTNDAASATIATPTGSAISGSTGVFYGSSVVAAVADVSSQATRSTLVSQYNAILTQIDNTAADSSYNGVNLLNGDQLQLTFNETGKSKLNITGVNFGSAGLGLSSLTSGTAFVDNNATNTVLGTLNTVSATLRSQASALGSNLSIVQTRQDFNKNLINVLQTGSANLTQADINLEAANSQALSTRQSLSVSALSLANQSQQSVLQLLR